MSGYSEGWPCVSANHPVWKLVNDEAEAGAAVHDHHGEFSAAALDAVHVRDLRPRELPIERVEPAECRFGASHRDAFGPGRAVSRQIEDTHDDVFVATRFVPVIGIEREREMMD